MKLILRRWTKAAKECLDRGCVCRGCYYARFFEYPSANCGMKKHVIALVRKFGHPKDVQPKTTPRPADGGTGGEGRP